jgi:alanyl-tRNA synthetase
VDLTQLMAEEHGLTVDAAGFEAAMEEARQKSRAGGRKAGVSALG